MVYKENGNSEAETNTQILLRQKNSRDKTQTPGQPCVRWANHRHVFDLLIAANEKLYWKPTLVVSLILVWLLSPGRVGEVGYRVHKPGFAGPFLDRRFGDS